MGGGLSISLIMHMHNKEKKKREEKKKMIDMNQAECDMVSNQVMLLVTEQSEAKS